MIEFLEKKKISSEANPDDVVEELDNWYQQNIRMIADFKYLYDKGYDFMRANRTDRLHKMSY